MLPQASLGRLLQVSLNLGQTRGPPGPAQPSRASAACQLKQEAGTLAGPEQKGQRVGGDSGALEETPHSGLFKETLNTALPALGVFSLEVQFIASLLHGLVFDVARRVAHLTQASFSLFSPGSSAVVGITFGSDPLWMVFFVNTVQGTDRSYCLFLTGERPLVPTPFVKPCPFCAELIALAENQLVLYVRVHFRAPVPLRRVCGAAPAPRCLGCCSPGAPTGRLARALHLTRCFVCSRVVLAAPVLCISMCFLKSSCQFLPKKKVC